MNFYDINWALWIPSQIFAFFALIVMVYAMAISKTKTRTLIAIIIFNTLMTVSVALLSNWLLVGIYFVAIFRDLVFIWREKKHPNNNALSLTTLFSFLIIAIIIAGFTIDWRLPSWELTLAVCIQLMALFIIYGAWAKGIHMIRISRFAFCTLAIVNHMIFQNYIAIVIEAFAICAIIVFYIKFFRRHSGRGSRSELRSEESSEAPITPNLSESTSL